MFGKRGKMYSEEIRKFCFTLHYYSPRAYFYVREKFKNNLPGESTIRNWFSSINGSPGFTQDSFDALQKKVECARTNGIDLYACLIFDEMAIRRQAIWDHNQKKYRGFVDMGKDAKPGQQSIPLAKNALVYLVSGINESFKIPVANFLVNKLNADEKAAITQELLKRLSETGLKIIAMTFDGDPTNMSVCKRLGAKYDDDEPFIFDPIETKRKIYIFLDAAHMLKLARNTLANKGVLYDSHHRPIEWNLIKLLYKTQQNLEWNLGNKLTKVHIKWYKRKMCVALAAQTISRKVASSLTYLKGKIDGFENVDGLVEYNHTIKDIFDIMNSNKIEGAEGFKRPINKSTHVEFFDRFKDAMSYIKGLTVVDDYCEKSILSARVQTAYIGFYYNMMNFMNIYDEYIEPGLIENLLTHRFSQDLIETLFSCIRSMNGRNDNPNPIQFEGAYRKLLIHNDVVCSKYANSIDSGTKILTVSSAKRKVQSSNIGSAYVPDEDLNFLQDFEQPVIFENTTDKLKYHSLVLVASNIEQTIIKAKAPRILIKCDQCLDVFIENEIMDDDFVRAMGKGYGQLQPCKSTFHICKFVDKFVEHCANENVSYHATVNWILQNLDFDSVYPNSSFHRHQEKSRTKNHKYDLVKCVVETYLDVKSRNSAKTITLQSHDEFIRSDYTQKIHLAGQ